MQFKLRLDEGYKPAYLFVRDFLYDVDQSGKGQQLKIALERNNGYTYVYETRVFEDGYKDELNTFYVERIIKSLLWVVGGFRIYIYGSKHVYEQIKEIYKINGTRHFDVDFMQKIYEHEFEVILCDETNFPEAKECSLSVGRNLDGCRIGFDAGGSDVKVSAVVNGESIFSEEIVWLPKLNSDPQYHYERIKAAMLLAASKMERVDAVGISSAGIYVDNKIMVASLFIKVEENDFNQHVKNMYIDIVKECFGDVPLEVANDGDVTALAGAMDLNDNQILGIAMGTSEAVGYIDEAGNIKGWLNELAFAPVDYNVDTIVDEWSGDYGVGCKYFSQDAVVKLAPRAGIELDENLTLAEKLKVVQKLMNEDDPRAIEVFSTIGVYLGYTLAYYSLFYDIKHLMLLGRVSSGKGGDLIIAKAKEVLNAEFKHLANINLFMPDEKARRVGQSIAAASLPKTK
jgi:predicted NBD/HSP70 family sugar kinase